MSTFLTAQIHSAHNGMMQRKAHESSVEALGRDVFSACRHFPLGGCLNAPPPSLCGLSVALCTHLLGTAAECGHKRTFRMCWDMWRGTPAPMKRVKTCDVKLRVQLSRPLRCINKSVQRAVISLVGYLHTCFLNLSLPRKENEEKESSPSTVKPKYFTVISGMNIF